MVRMLKRMGRLGRRSKEDRAEQEVVEVANKRSSSRKQPGWSRRLFSNKQQTPPVEEDAPKVPSREEVVHLDPPAQPEWFSPESAKDDVRDEVPEDEREQPENEPPVARQNSDERSIVEIERVLTLVDMALENLQRGDGGKSFADMLETGDSAAKVDFTQVEDEETNRDDKLIESDDYECDVSIAEDARSDLKGKVIERKASEAPIEELESMPDIEEVPVVKVADPQEGLASVNSLIASIQGLALAAKVATQNAAATPRQTHAESLELLKKDFSYLAEKEIEAGRDVPEAPSPPEPSKVFVDHTDDDQVEAICAIPSETQSMPAAVISSFKQETKEKTKEKRKNRFKWLGRKRTMSEPRSPKASVSEESSFVESYSRSEANEGCTESYSRMETNEGCTESYSRTEADEETYATEQTEVIVIQNSDGLLEEVQPSETEELGEDVSIYASQSSGIELVESHGCEIFKKESFKEGLWDLLCQRHGNSFYSDTFSVLEGGPSKPDAVDKYGSQEWGMNSPTVSTFGDHSDVHSTAETETQLSEIASGDETLSTYDEPQHHPNEEADEETQGESLDEGADEDIDHLRSADSSMLMTESIELTESQLAEEEGLFCGL